MREKVCRLDKKYRYTIIAVFLVGICAHGYMFTNKISYHDDICDLFALGSTLSVGRWSLELILYVLSHTVGKYSMPLWIGVLSMLFISASACMIIDLLEIKDTFECVLLGSIMIVFPAVTMTFVYMFTAGCYFGALFLVIFAVWLLEKYWSAWSVIGAVICIAFSTGIYQAYFSVGISLILLLTIKNIFRGGAKWIWINCQGMQSYIC